MRSRPAVSVVDRVQDVQQVQRLADATVLGERLPERVGRPLEVDLSAAQRWINWDTLPLGGLVGGALGSAIGVHATLWVAAAGGCSSGLWLSPGVGKHHRRAATPVGDEQAGAISGFDERHVLSFRRSGRVMSFGGRLATGRAAAGRAAARSQPRAWPL
jgi:hypothetical protein